MVAPTLQHRGANALRVHPRSGFMTDPSSSPKL